jgi:cytochrome c-type biogenesis protein
VLLSYRYEANLLAGAVVILFGLFMMGLANLSWLQREFRFHPSLKGGHPAAAYLIGIAFAFGWTPCIGPVLGAILTTSSVSATVPQGAALLSVYSLGLGLPFLAAAIFTESLMMRLRVFGRLGRSLHVGAGAIVAGMGVAILTGELTTLSYWLLDTFPFLTRLG